jgi:hypothetical protein
MPINVKEIKNDAIISIKVNKNFYMMSKALSFYLYQRINEQPDNENYLKDIMSKTYEELDDLQKSFYTVALLLAEIEKNAKELNLYDEKEILVPGDKGYVNPNQD